MAFHPLVKVPEEVLIGILECKEQSDVLKDFLWILEKRSGCLSARQIEKAQEIISEIHLKDNLC